MNLINCSKKQFENIAEDKKIFCFGAGASGISFCESLEVASKNIVLFSDNDKNKWNKQVSVNGRNIDVVSPSDLVGRFDHKVGIIFITSRFWDEIVEQLEKLPELKDAECYISMLFHSDCSDIKLEKTGKELIPRVIHYCWFGGNPIPSYLQSYIDTWKKYCPDYEIIRWDESNYDVEKNDFLRSVKKHKRWNDVCNYARFDMIYKMGGIYLDTDVELVRSFDDLLTLKGFMGFEVSGDINSGHGFGAQKGDEIILSLRQMYDDIGSVPDDINWRNFDSCPRRTTKLLLEKGLVLNNKFQMVGNITVFPNDYFDPVLQIANNSTYSIHHYSSLWGVNNNKDMQSVWKKQQDYYKNLIDNNKIKEL